MKHMIDTGRRMARISAFACLALVASLATFRPAAAQDEPPKCHCVDRDGNRIDDCVCLTVPHPRAAFEVTSFARRAVVGVTIDYEQPADVDARGAEIQEVRPDGPADRAGLQAGDIVLSVAGHSVFDPLDRAEERRISESQSVPVQRFVRLVGGLEPGEPVDIEFRRDGRTRTVTVTPDPDESPFGSLPGLTLFSDSLPQMAWSFEGPTGDRRIHLFADTLATFDAEPFERRFFVDPCMGPGSAAGRNRVWALGGGNCVDGVEFIDLNPELGEYFGTSEGVLVARVAEASTLGLRAGDVLLAVDGREVRSSEHARRILASYDADEDVRLRVMRKGRETEVLGRRR